MTKIQFDQDLLAAVSLEIADRFTLLTKLFPKDIPLDDQVIIKHLAACSIHLALFMKDIHQHLTDQKIDISSHMKKFLEQCGCDFNNNHKEIK